MRSKQSKQIRKFLKDMYPESDAKTLKRMSRDLKDKWDKTPNKGEKNGK